jgi:hypothetical protein
MQPEQWEYEFFSTMDLLDPGWFRQLSRDTVRDHLNKLGQEGWEIITVQFAGANEQPQLFSAILKRRKQK